MYRKILASTDVIDSLEHKKYLKFILNNNHTSPVIR